jgi:Cellulase (glycosyl hydrolase family 5)
MTSPPPPQDPRGPGGTEPIPTFTYEPERPRRPLGLIIGVAAAVVVLLGGGLFAVLNGKSSTPGPGPAAPTGAPAPAAAPGAITVDGDRIMRDGEPWWFVGYNSFVWSGDCGGDDDNEEMSQQDVDNWFASMRHDGHGAVRLFFFDGWDEQRLDAAVQAAKKNNIYLMITLADAHEDCGQDFKVDPAWFDNQRNVDAFKAHMTKLVTKYKGDPTIAWFEYFNEPKYNDGKLRKFYDQMGAVAKGIDPTRLFSSGTIAVYDFQDNDNWFREVSESPGVDIASLHEYDQDQVESSHGPKVRANSGGKPVIVGEFGIKANANGNDCDASFQERAALTTSKEQAYTGEGYAGALMWAWQPSVKPDECDTSNLNSDPATQDALRSFIPS